MSTSKNTDLTNKASNTNAGGPAEGTYLHDGEGGNWEKQRQQEQHHGSKKDMEDTSAKEVEKGKKVKGSFREGKGDK